MDHLNELTEFGVSEHFSNVEKTHERGGRPKATNSIYTRRDAQGSINTMYSLAARLTF